MNSIADSLMGKLFSKRKKSAGPSRSGSSARNVPLSNESTIENNATEITDGGMSNVLLQHDDAVVSVASLQQGLCLSGSKDCKIILYDYINGKLVEKWEGHGGAITKVLFGTACNGVFSSSRDKTIKLWRRGNNQCLQTFTGHDLVVTAIHLSADNSMLCSGSRDNSVKLWDVHTGACLRSNSIPQNLVTDVKFVPESSLIIQTGEDKEVRIFDLRNLQPVFSFPKKQYIQMCCDVSPDGNFVVSSSNGFSGNGCEATLWDLRTRNLYKEYRGHREAVEACMFLPSTTECSLVATASRDCSVKVWDMMGGECRCECFVSGSGPLTSLAAYQDGSILVGSFNQGVQLFRLADNNLSKQLHY